MNDGVQIFDGTCKRAEKLFSPCPRRTSGPCEALRAPPINELALRNPLKCERVDQARSSEKLRANNDSNDGDSTGDSDDDGSRGGSGGDSNKLRLEPRCRLRLRRQRLTSQRFSLRFA